VNYRRDGRRQGVLSPVDLSALERRGLLSAIEKRRLQMALVASEPLRCSHQLGVDFDHFSTTSVDDDQLVERLVERAQARYGKSSGLRSRVAVRRVVVWLGVSSLFLMSAAAGAALWPHVQKYVVGTSSPRPNVPRQTVGSRVRTFGAVTPAVTATPRQPYAAALGAPEAVAESKAASAELQSTRFAEREAEADVSESSSRLSNERRGGSSPGRAFPEAHGAAAPPIAVASAVAAISEANGIDVSLEMNVGGASSAAALFSAANLARRRGAHVEANALYQKLRKEFPVAPQTILSFALTGRLRLQSLDAASALREFDQYLRLSPSGSLSQEALQGRAEALRLLGRRHEEVLAWRELIRRYPDSLYRQAAEVRLRELP
jgi:TolA-binding protein